MSFKFGRVRVTNTVSKFDVINANSFISRNDNGAKSTTEQPELVKPENIATDGIFAELPLRYV